MSINIEPKSHAIHVYTHPSEVPYLTVVQYVIIRAIVALDKLDALALIRGAYASPDGTFASLKDAETIYSIIINGQNARPSKRDGSIGQ